MRGLSLCDYIQAEQSLWVTLGASRSQGQSSKESGLEDKVRKQLVIETNRFNKISSGFQ